MKTLASLISASKHNAVLVILSLTFQIFFCQKYAHEVEHLHKICCVFSVST